MTGVRFVAGLYALLLRLYPETFRAEFGEEMMAVFGEAARAAAAQGERSLWRLCLRELRDWPGAAARAHWRSLGIRKEGAMQGGLVLHGLVGEVWDGSEHASEPGAWREAVLAALPHLLVTLIFCGLGLLQAYELTSYATSLFAPLGIVSVVVSVFVLIAVFVVAWRRGWPRWSASWYVYWFLLVMLPLLMAAQALQDLTRSPVWEAFVYVGLPLLTAGLLCRAVRHGRLIALLAVLPLLPLVWSTAVEFVSPPIRAWVVLGAWMLVTLTALTVVRVGSLRLGIWLVGGLNLVTGLAYTYVRTFHMALPPEALRFSQNRPPPTVTDWLYRFVPSWLAISTFILGPLLVWFLRELGRRSGRLGMAGYLLSFAGVLIGLGSNLGTFWWYASMVDWFAPMSAPPAGVLWLQGLVYLAVMLYLAGSILLGGVVLQNDPPRSVLVLVPLFLVLFVLPLVSTLPMIFGFQFIPMGWPLGLYRLNNIPRIWVDAVGLGWLLLAGWLVTRRSGQRAPTAAA